MIFECQESTKLQLTEFAKSDRHSIIIYGESGCGKTHMARQYAQMLDISDFNVVSPTIGDLQETMGSLVESSNKTCICIENLDLGMISVSYSILKFIEEPKSNVYIVITCRTLNNIPDTILSRCVSVKINSPKKYDITTYCKTNRFEDYARLKSHPVLSCIKSFSDVDIVMDMNADKLRYFEEIDIGFHDTVGNISYKLTHYADKSKTPLHIVLRWIYNKSTDMRLKSIIVTCLSELDEGRIADWCILDNAIFKCKYGI